MPTTPLGRILRMRQEAISRLFDAKFKAITRITVGSATCENAAGANPVYDRFAQLFEQHRKPGFALGRVGCAGRCDLEPAVTVIGKGKIPVKYVKMTAAKVDHVFQSHILNGKVVEEYTMEHIAGLGQFRKVVSVCHGASCIKKNLGIEKAFQDAIAKLGLQETVAVTRSACQGLCERGPIAFVYPDSTVYQKVTPEIAERIVEKHLKGGKPIAEHVWSGKRLANRFLPIYGNVQFFGKQLRLTLRNCGVIDPESLDEYFAVQGYEALGRVLTEMTQKQVIDTMLKSGLRGRGGGGYPAGKKWQIAHDQKSDRKYFICNADEGDPGAFMDRSTIEGDPHTILEGLMIGGYAIGAEKGFVYIRAEYPMAIQRLEKAIVDARTAGLLGQNILGSNFHFDIELRLGAGAFVCGEETALLASIEGSRGMPHPRPPYPTVSGLWGMPTVINNVETLANIPVVILDGPVWFSSIGTPKSKGTKVFSLAGKVNNTGLIEVPMGTTLREVVYDVGGGIKGGKQFKAVQTGGPAGGCLPESTLDTPVDYDSLMAAGSIMGSGGMIVMDEDSCMVDVARFFLEFTQDESCGKCTPCREGTTRMREMLERITGGKGKEGDVEKLLRLADTVQKASLCGLGQAAPNPVISTIKHFRHEYDAHIREKKCLAGVCAALVMYSIDPDKCIGCTACLRKCPVQCIAGSPKQVHVIDQSACVKCGQCLLACKFGAVFRK
jgi:NADH:ubiquinone oxidoreductase subunit F (NADH-binding)/(2Fe-2S) ferredoxin